MPWIRRCSTMAVTVATALLIYAAYTLLILRQLSRYIQCGIASRPRDPHPGYVEAFELLLPMWIVWGLWLIIPVTGMGFEIYWKSQRWWRDRNGQCVDCGYRLTTWRGKCPGCGLRIGPG